MRDDDVASPVRLVSVVDDDLSVRESLPELLQQFGFAARVFDSAQAFLGSDALDRTDCLILDVAMQGMSGLELQTEVARHRRIPIIFISANVDQAVTARALARGAAAFLHKPFSESELMQALVTALEPGRPDARNG
jgi:FixJ family two-component response regulator